MIVQYVTNEEENQPGTDAMSTVAEADPDPPTYRYHEDQLEPYGVRYHSMKAIKTVIKSFCLERNYPFYAEQSDRKRYLVRCPETKSKRKQKKKNQGSASQPSRGEEGEDTDEVMEETTAAEVFEEEATQPFKCSFFISARLQGSFDDDVVVVAREFNHSCGCMLRAASSNNRVSSAWVGTESRDILYDVPTAKVRNLQRSMKRRLGTNAKYSVVHKAQSMEKKKRIADEVLSFQYVEPYFRKLVEVMPDSIAVLERDSRNHLVRTFVMLEPLVRSFRHHLPLLTVDACHLTSSFKGVLMAATMMDAEHGTQLLAWGTSPTENANHWGWFFSLLRRGLLRDYSRQDRETMAANGGQVSSSSHRRRLTFFSDREKGIIQSLKEKFPESSHQYCMVHIEKNIKCQMGLTNEVRELMLDASRTPIEAVFDENMEEILSLSPQVHAYLSKIDPCSWTTSHCPTRRYGVMTSNNSEQMNSWILELRDGSQAKVHAMLVAKAMRRQCERREELKLVTTDFPDRTYGVLKDVNAAGRNLHVWASSETQFLVTLHQSGENDIASGREVCLRTLSNPECTCMVHKSTGMPCRHMAAALQHLSSRRAGGQRHEIEDFVEHYYRTDTQRKAYEPVILPCSAGRDQLKPDGITLPNADTPRRGRPKKKRIRGASEQRRNGPLKRKIKCRKCKQFGHNARTCERRQGEDEEDTMEDGGDVENYERSINRRAEVEDTLIRQGFRLATAESSSQSSDEDGSDEDENNEDIDDNDEDREDICVRRHENEEDSLEQGGPQEGGCEVQHGPLLQTDTDDDSSGEEAVRNGPQLSKRRAKNTSKESNNDGVSDSSSSSSSTDSEYRRIIAKSKNTPILPRSPPRDMEGRLIPVYSRGKNKGQTKKKRITAHTQKHLRGYKDGERIRIGRPRNPNPAPPPVPTPLEQRKRIDKQPRLCGHCKQPGHYRSTCPVLQREKFKQWQEEGTCDGPVLETNQPMTAGIQDADDPNVGFHRI